MIDTQQHDIRLTIRGEISVIVKNKFYYDYSVINHAEGSASSKDVIKINKKKFLYAETYYMLRFVQIRNNRYEKD